MGARKDRVRVALQWYLASCLPAERLCCPASVWESTSCLDSAGSAVLSSEIENPKEELCTTLQVKQAPPFHLRSCCSQSFSRNLLLHYLFYCLLPHVLAHISLTSLSCVFPSFTSKLSFLHIFLSLSFAMCVTICIYWSVSFCYVCYFDLLWGFPWLSALLFLPLIPPFTCSFWS